MANDKEISSTEKLLGVIRRTRDAGRRNTMPETGPSPHTRPKRTEIFRLGASKRTTVGVDIGHIDLKLVRTIQNSPRDFLLDNYLTLPFPEGVQKSGTGFAGFLREAFENFGSPAGKERVWCSMSSADVDMGHIKIPKVARNQIANAVYFTVKKENPFDEDKFFLDFEVQGEVMENGTPRIRVLYYLAPRKEVNEVKALFSIASIRLTGVSIGAFANQNFFRTNWLPAGDGPAGNLYIGRNWSRIDIFAGGNLMLTREIKTGISSMVETLMETYNERSRRTVVPGNQSPRSEPLPTETRGESAGTAVRGFDGEMPPVSRDSEETPFHLDENNFTLVDAGETEPFPIGPERAEKITMSLSPERPQLKPGEQGYELSDDEKFAMLKPAAERLLRQVERTFEHYATTLGFGRVQKIFVSGGIDGYHGLVDYIGSELGIDRDIVDPMDPRNPAVGEALPPDSLRERLSYTLATGLSLSDDARTPNLINPYEARDKAARVTRFNRMIFVLFLLLLTASGSYHLWQKNIEGRRQAAVAALQSEISQYGVALDRELVVSMVGAVSDRKKAVESVSERYVSVAVLGEVASCTPETIRLLLVRTILPASDRAEKPGIGAARPVAGHGAGSGKMKHVSIEGLVFGGPKQFDSILAGYLVKLENLPIFRNPGVEKTEIQKYKEQKVLRFTLSLEVI